MKACKRAKKSIEQGPKGGYKILGLILLSCKKSSIVCSTQERDDDTTNGIRTVDKSIVVNGCNLVVYFTSYKVEGV